MYIEYAIIVWNMSEKFNFGDVRLIAGLGNPGGAYAETFHNTGMQFVSYALDQYAENTQWKKHSSGFFVYAKCDRYIFVTPLVFMNESGSALLCALSFFKIPPEKMVVIHDDADIHIGSYKIDYDRSAAGHRGILDIIRVLGTQSFWRIRIGIRNPIEEKRKKALSFVLSKETDADTRTLKSVFSSILKETPLI
jgi:PTH1 family peptidyl-tRNA hydrolase